MRRACHLLLCGVLVAVGGYGCSKNNEKPSTQPECSDGKDNDGDGLVDFPDDPGCTAETDDSEDSPPAPQCSDGKDNDGDGKIDYPNDPGCTAPNQEDESDPCPGEGCPECSDGKDNDSNGTTDFPNDPGCSSAADNSESTANPAACGTNLMIMPLPATGNVSGTLDGTSTSMTPSPCGEENGAGAIAYQFRAEEAVTLVATTDQPGTTANTVIDVRSAMCSAATSEVACNDDTMVGDTSSTVTAALVPGTYYIIVKLQNSGASTTDFQLQVNLYKAEGQACTDNTECAPPDTCRTPMGGSMMVCSKPVCNDGVDDDGDGKADYPDDPGCDSPNDLDETDDCPSGPNCPVCSNGIDDDMDGKTDYPADTSCASAAGGSEACSTEHDAIPTVTAKTTSSTFIGMHDDEMASCATDAGQDRMYTLKVPALRTLTITPNEMNNFMATELLTATCTVPGLACEEGSSAVTATSVAAGTYILLFDFEDDGFDTPGPFSFTVAGQLEPGQKCDAASTLNGAFTCAAVNPCTLVGADMICKPTQCSDGIDNDGDGKKDYPNDPGCTDPDDDTETDTCPGGATCPKCANGIDDDGDGKTDYPADTSCASASQNSEADCAFERDPIVTITGTATAGDLTSAHDDRAYASACSSIPETGGADLTYKLVVPATDTMTIGTTGGTDTVVSLLPNSCGEPHLACDDEGGVMFGDSLFTTGPLAAGTYFVSVDAWEAGSEGPFTLNVTGTIAVGGSCAAADTLGGALTCGTGHTCSATTHKCQ